MNDPTTTRPQRSRTPRRTGWHVPAAALVLVLALAIRVLLAHESPAPPTESRSPGHTGAAEPELGPGRVDVPRGWRVVERTGAVTTWSDHAQAHGVTVASVESSSAPLAAVVAAVAKDARTSAATLRVRAPREVELGSAPRGDSAFVVELEALTSAEATVHVRQIWRRDSRTRRDVVATWTSTDGRWPVELHAGIPEAATS